MKGDEEIGYDGLINKINDLQLEAASVHVKPEDVQADTHLMNTTVTKAIELLCQAEDMLKDAKARAEGK